MKKFSVLIALALLAVAGTGYADERPTKSVQVYSAPLPASIFADKVIGLTIPVKVASLGKTTDYILVPTAPCRLVDTNMALFARDGEDAVAIHEASRSATPLIYGGGPFQDGETRTYPLSGTCLDVPEAAKGIVIKVTTLGLLETYQCWTCTGGVDTTTDSTPQNSGGLPSGGGKPHFVIFQVGQVNTATGVVLVNPVRALNGSFMYSTLGLKATGGVTNVVVDVLGYIK